MVGRKPSIFSNNYRKKVRKRKIRIVTTIVILFAVVGVSVTLFYTKGKTSFFTSIFGSKNAIEEAPNENDNLSNNEEPSVAQEEETEKEKDSFKSYEVNLESGKKVNFTYKDDGESRKIQVVDSDLEVKCNISPSQENLLITDGKTQDIYLINKKNELNKITNAKYVSTNNETFTKESVLSYTPGYKWVGEAKFIDESHVAYTSALPWINEGENVYLWVIDLNTGNHKGNYNIKGKEFTLGEITDKGLQLTVDGKNLVIDGQGKIVQ